MNTSEGYRILSFFCWMHGSMGGARKEPLNLLFLTGTTDVLCARESNTCIHRMERLRFWWNSRGIFCFVFPVTPAFGFSFPGFLPRRPDLILPKESRSSPVIKSLTFSRGQCCLSSLPNPKPMPVVDAPFCEKKRNLIGSAHLLWRQIISIPLGTGCERKEQNCALSLL